MSKTDYDLSLIKAFVFDIDGVLSPSTIPMAPHARAIRMANVKDGFAIKHAVKQGYKVAIISGADDDAISDRFHALGVDEVHLNLTDKIPVLKDFLRRYKLDGREVVYAGDDIPDLECMRLCGLTVCPADAAIDIKKISRYISPFIGGYGVGRDIIEQVLRAQGKWIKI